MHFLRHQGGESTELKMTAMIDVVFLLLVFFVTTTRFRIPEGELQAYLPPEGRPVEPHERKIPVDEIRITLRVAREGTAPKTEEPEVFIDGKRLGDKVDYVSLGQLRDRLVELAPDAEMRKEVPVIINSQKTLAYRWVIATLDICRSIGFDKVHFAASPAG